MSSPRNPRPGRPIPSTRTSCLHMLCMLAIVLSFGCQEEADPYEEVLRLQDRGEYAASIEPLRELLEERGDDPEIHYLYGRALTVTGQAGLAEWALRKAAKSPDWLVPAGTQIASSALQAQNFDTAIEMATRVLEVEPDNVDVMLIRAKAYARSRLHGEEAIEETDRILAVEPDNTDAMEPRILALLTLERIDEAEQEIDRLGRMIEEKDDASEWIRGWHCATTALFASDSGEHELATERWNDCLERFPGHSNVVGNAVGFFDDQGDYQRSLEVLRNALEAEPAAIDYRRRLALRLRYAGEVEEAEQVLEEGTELGGRANRMSAWQILAKHHQDVGDDEAAVEAMKQAIEIGRESGSVLPQLLFDYADALVLLGDFDAALAVADEMTLVAHQEMIRARVAQERGEHEAALEHFEQAFALWPDNPWARYLAAASAEALGQFDRAIELYRYAIRIRADATDARYRLAGLLTATGDVNEALAILSMPLRGMELSMDGRLLALELNAWAGEQQTVAGSLGEFRQWGPGLTSRALAATAEGIERRSGAEAAAQFLERYGTPTLLLQDPTRPQAMRLLVELREETGHLPRLEKAVDTLVEKRPEAAPVHAVRGLWLERSGAPETEVRAAYERAVELDPENADALAGLGRLALDDDPQAALDYFDRAVAADPGDDQHAIGGVRAAKALGNEQEVVSRLEAMLEAHPRSPWAAVQLTRIRMQAGDASDRTQALAQRAVTLQGGIEALQLLAQVYRAREEPQKATQVEARIRALEQQDGPEAPAPPA